MHFIFLAQADAPGCAQAAFLPLMIVVIFYFLMWRPQQKQAQEAQRFRDSLKDGDRVITAGGLHGRVERVEDDVIEIQVAPNTKIRVERSQVVKHQKPNE